MALWALEEAPFSAPFSSIFPVFFQRAWPEWRSERECDLEMHFFATNYNTVRSHRAIESTAWTRFSRATGISAPWCRARRVGTPRRAQKLQ
jgi:hypothetical protein